MLWPIDSMLVLLYSSIHMVKEIIKNYLIDCIGYSEEDLKGKTIKELMSLIDDEQDFIKFVG